jgi:hypothetical protein
MKRLATTLAASLAALAVSAGSAFAAGSPVQSATQSSGTDQGAIAASSATQVDPSNQNISVRVLSPGSDGNVTQSNNATSTATAANTAGTTQTATQLQGGGCGCQLTPVQQILQDTANGQLGGVLSAAQQLGASNAAAPSSVASPSGSGDPTSQPSTAAPSAAAPAAPSTTQSNGATSTGSATNTAPTGQTASQTQGGSGVQSADQQAQTDQTALAGSSAQQVDPSNSNISVRVLSPGSDGNVTQSNNATSTATAANNAATTQKSGQIQGGGGSGVQSSTQDAQTQQGAGAASSAAQDHPSNSNLSVRVLSPGSDGNVTQSNNATSTATATNSAPVNQTSFQDPSGPSCGCGGQGQDVQSITQGSWIGQIGDAQSSATQVGASNSNDPVRVGSDGSDGNVTQSNNTTSTASATNTAPVSQTGTQINGDAPWLPCGCGGSDPSVQALGQSSWIGQGAQALSSADQVGASNSNDPVRIGSDGSGGSVTQSNNDTSTATATNTAPVTQTGTQEQSGSPCGCGGSDPAVQALAQDSFTGQLAGAASSALQVGASNSSDPVRIWSDGSDGNLTQSNNATSTATAANNAATTQMGEQEQSGSGIQALAQKAGTLQGAFALSSAAQLPGEPTCGCEGSSGSFGNEAGPIRIGSDGNNGNVTQTNNASSTASGTNGAATDQTGEQTQAGSPCGCGGLGIQALGQEAFTAQLSKALSSAWQIGAKNASDPVRVWSFGGGGTTSQANGANSQASAPNMAGTGQNASQAQIGAPIKI